MTTTVISWIEIPQCSTYCRTEVVLSFRSEAREILSVKRREFITLLGVAAARPPVMDDIHATPPY
jgi:hypothetical protein